MIKFGKSVKACQSPAFNDIFKAELEQLDAGLLPLQDGLSQSSYVSDRPFQVIVLSVVDDAETVRVKAGVFYTGLIPGCACADDPTPEDEYTEYCEVFVEIDKETCEAGIQMVEE